MVHDSRHITAPLAAAGLKMETRSQGAPGVPIPPELPTPGMKVAAMKTVPAPAMDADMKEIPMWTDGEIISHVHTVTTAVVLTAKEEETSAVRTTAENVTTTADAASEIFQIQRARHGADPVSTGQSLHAQADIS